jgi:hypothetical protein
MVNVSGSSRRFMIRRGTTNTYFAEPSGGTYPGAGVYEMGRRGGSSADRNDLGQQGAAGITLGMSVSQINAFIALSQAFHEALTSIAAP